MPQPSHPNMRTSTRSRIQPPGAVPPPADTRHRALAGVQHSMVPTTLEGGSSKFGISATEVLHAPQLRRLQPDVTRSSFGTYLEMKAVSLTYLEHRTA